MQQVLLLFFILEKIKAGASSPVRFVGEKERASKMRGFFSSGFLPPRYHVSFRELLSC